MAIRNFTPHAINVYINEELTITFPSEGIARCAVSSVKVSSLPVGKETIDVFANSYGAVEGLPDENGQDTFIVSFPVFSALAGKRSDLVGPDTSPAGNPIRDDKGQIVAVRRFQTV